MDSGDSAVGYWGPTLTVVYAGDADRAFVADLLERLLSAMTYAIHTPIDAVSYGASGGDPEALPTVRAPGSRYGRIIHTPPRQVEVDDDLFLRLALGYWREGINASSPFYGFLAYWNTLDAAFRGEEKERDKFIRSAGADLAQFGGRPEHEPMPTDIPNYLRDSSRNAIAHVIRDSPGKTTISPDSSEDRRRLTLDREWVRHIARGAIAAKWQSGVRSYVDT